MPMILKELPSTTGRNGQSTSVINVGHYTLRVVYVGFETTYQTVGNHPDTQSVREPCWCMTLIVGSNVDSEGDQSERSFQFPIPNCSLTATREEAVRLASALATELWADVPDRAAPQSPSIVQL